MQWNAGLHMFLFHREMNEKKSGKKHKRKQSKHTENADWGDCPKFYRLLELIGINAKTKKKPHII